ncbi:hypothetical protein AXY46_03460 [Achromobacter xylosoxidans]|nr:hypothetical protein AXY46_03460 [Achromobacter xylosoxidans]
MGMDWKFALGTLFAALGGLFALMNRHPRVYKAIANVLTDIIGFFGTASMGLYLGGQMATDLIRDSAARQMPDITAATVGQLLSNAERAITIFGWATALIFALFVGHLVFGILAVLAVNEEDKKAKG